MEFTVVQGDIARQEADALVNAAGTSLQMGSGVAGALRRAAGDALNQAAIERGPIGLGEVAVTDAFELPAEYVIHAAAMPHYGDGQATVESIRLASQHALTRADELGCTSLVIPALGCGVAGFDLERGARIICEEIADSDPASLDDVRFIAYDEQEYETVAAVASSIQEDGPA